MAQLDRFWRNYLRRYAGWYLLGVICLVATNALTVAIPGFVKEAIDALARGDGANEARDWAIAIVFAGLGIIVVRTLSRTLFFNPGRAVEFRVKNALFRHLLTLPRTFFDRLPAGEIISRGTNDTNAVRSLAGFATLQLFNVVLMLALTLGKMTTMDPVMTLYCALPLTGALVVLRFAVRAMFSWTREAQSEIARLSGRILETYQSIGMLRAYGAIEASHRRFDVANDRLLEIGLALTRIRAWLLPIISVVGSLTIVLVLFVGGRRVIAGDLSIGDIAAFSVYIGILVNGLISLGWMVNAMQRGWIALGRVDEVLDEPVVAHEGRLSLPPARGQGPEISVRNLSFGYDAEAPVLDDISFDVASGEVVGIFGLTGSGKSTLLSVLARVHEAPPGAVHMDGVDIAAAPVRAHWHRLAYVTQEPFLFSRSIRANITWALDTDEVDDSALQSVLNDACLTPDLAQFPEGISTVVGERGITLSGGQRQRVALARAFFRDYDLLLLDDVLSAVDHATEEQLVDAIYARTAFEGGGRRTAVIVSHRLSVLSKADRVLVLEDGKMVDIAPHAELITREDGAYRRAWQLQQAADRLAALEGGQGG
ncbi:MAG: ABC transporter ATP-binding protein [Myxococcota bacterium]